MSLRLCLCRGYTLRGKHKAQFKAWCMYRVKCTVTELLLRVGFMHALQMQVTGINKSTIFFQILKGLGWYTFFWTTINQATKTVRRETSSDEMDYLWIISVTNTLTSDNPNPNPNPNLSLRRGMGLFHVTYSLSSFLNFRSVVRQHSIEFWKLTKQNCRFWWPWLVD